MSAMVRKRPNCCVAAICRLVPLADIMQRTKCILCETPLAERFKKIELSGDPVLTHQARFRMNNGYLPRSWSAKVMRHNS